MYPAIFGARFSSLRSSDPVFLQRTEYGKSESVEVVATSSSSALPYVTQSVEMEVMHLTLPTRRERVFFPDRYGPKGAR